MASKPLTVQLKALLEAKMKDAIETNGLEYRGGFLTVEAVTDILTKENLAKQLAEHPDARWHSWHARGELAGKIRDNQKQLYTILLLINESHRIHRVHETEVDSIKDEFLFKTTTTGYTQERLKNLSFFEGIATAFYRKQWIFPPGLSTSKTLDFPAECFVFPFKSTRHTLGDGNGGYHGDVYAVEVPSYFLQTSRSDQSSQNHQVAYKRITKRKPEEWELVQREVDMLQARLHPNITPLLGNFYAGLESPNSADSPTRSLYLFSPLAIKDMESWFKDGYISMRTDQLRQFLYSEAMLGLASGLTYIHREINGRVGYHRDIKPSNFLLFNETGGTQVWKICDFGSSNLKSPDDTGTTNKVTTRYWAPAEYFMDSSSENGQSHGRSHDVFSLGCVFLELATILHRRREGLLKFKKLRGEDEAYPANLKEAPQGAFCKSMATVHAWVEELLGECIRDDDKKILAVIEEMLLPRNERIYTWEVEIDLFILSSPTRSCNEINKRLRGIIQESRGYDHQMKHNPYVRAQKKIESQTNNGEPMLRSDEFLSIISDASWRCFTPQSTTGSFKLSSNPQKTLSNIRSASQADTLFGRQDLYESISDSFNLSDIVALYGLGGVGKSRIAQEYALQFANPADKVLKRHTFEINATSKSTLLQSYDEIAHQVNRSHDASEFTTKSRDRITGNSLKTWLEDHENGGWFMVVHGFDSAQDAAELWPMLPKPESEYSQMIITTRTRATVKNRLNATACVQVDALSQADSMRLFTHHIQRKLTSRNQQSSADSTGGSNDYPTKSLVDKLWSPFMIKSAAKQMNDDLLTVGQMSEMLKAGGLSGVRTSFPDYLGYVLSPLDANGLSGYSSWPRVARFLLILAFFHPQGVGWDLLLLEYKQEANNLTEFLKTLQDCSMIWQDRRQDPPTYVLNSHVRRALLDWVEYGPSAGHIRSDDHGPKALLQRYNKALSMIYRAYKSKHNASAKRTKTSSFDPHAAKQALMPHFEGFLQFTDKYSDKLDFSLSDSAVRAVILFSKVLLDKDRYDDAMRVTAYAQKHFTCDLSETNAMNDEKSKQARVSFHLVRQLIKVYLAHPQDDDSIEYWLKAEALMKKLQQDAPQMEKLDLEWAKFTSPTLEIQLDKVRVLWKSGSLQDARRELSDIINSTGVLTIQEGQLLEPLQGEGRLASLGTPNNRVEEEKIRKYIRDIQLRVTRESGLLYTIEGDLYDQSNTKLAHKSWQKAREALLLARHAVRKWFSDDTALYAELSVEIAVVNTKIGTSNLVDEAIRTLGAACRRVKDRYGSCRRAWDLEQKLNDARLKSEHLVADGTKSSRELLELYEQRLGKEKMATKKCALQLANGLMLMGKLEERVALGERYPGLGEDLEQELRHDVGPSRTLTVSLVALFMVLSGYWWY